MFVLGEGRMNGLTIYKQFKSAKTEEREVLFRSYKEVLLGGWN